MDEDSVQHSKNLEGIRRLYTEMLMRTYNDILPMKWYQYYASQLFLECKPEVKKTIARKLRNHYESIDWLLNYSKDSLCFQVLGLEALSYERIVASISRKFHGSKKFHKLLNEITQELFHDTEAE